MNTVTVKVEWISSRTKLSWTDSCAQIMEQFGLPGNKYTTQIEEDAIKFHFKNGHDALMCRLLISDYV